MIKQALLPLCLVLALMPAQAQESGEWDADWDSVFDDPFQDPSESAQQTDPEFETDEVLAINLSAAGEAAALLLRFSVMEKLALNSLGFSVTRLRLPDSFRPLRALQALRAADPEGQYGPNAVYRLAGPGPAAASAAACEGLRCYGQSLVGWSAGCARRVRLGMLDSAVDLSSPALQGRQLYTTRIASGAATARERVHGTAIAALLVGDPHSGFAGLLPEAKLFAADVFALDRQAQPYTDALKLAEGLNWLAQQKLDALNISIAGPHSAVLQRAIQALDLRGVSMAAAAGNLGAQAAPQFPAAYPEVLAVTAVDRNLKLYEQANQGSYIRMAAPGVGIWTAGESGTGVFRDGTSYAAPYVTAALALTGSMQKKVPKPATRIGLLTRSSRDLGESGLDPVFGAGLLQAPRCTLDPSRK